MIGTYICGNLTIMTADYTAPENTLNRRTSENITTMLFRMGWKQKDLVPVMRITGTTIGRKLKNGNDWTLTEVELAAQAFYLSVGELIGDLPNWEEWRSRLAAKDDETPAENSGGFGEARPKGFEPLTF